MKYVSISIILLYGRHEIQDSRFTNFYSGKYTDHNENKNGHKCNIQVQYIIYIVGHTRKSYPLSLAVAWNWSTPLRFHRVWPTLPLGQTHLALGQSWLPQCQMSHSNEVLSSVIITTAKQITINIACVSCIQSSYSTLIDTLAQHPTDSQYPHWRKMRHQGYQVLKSAPQGSQ